MSKTTHGAYSQLVTAIRKARGHAGDADRNIVNLYAGRTLAENPALTTELNALTVRFRDVVKGLDELKEVTAQIAESQIKTLTGPHKETLIRRGDPPMRTRANRRD